MVANPEGKEGGAGGAAARTTNSGAERKSTQNTQYDQIGTKYLKIKELPAAESEVPSILAALGEDGVKGKRCLDLACGTGKYTHLLHTLGASSCTGYDISSTMISSALATYTRSQYPTMHFGVADCSIPESLPTLASDDTSGTGGFDLVFSAWFLNYAGTETELTNMFRVIESQMKVGGRFVGLTTNAHDPNMHIPKLDFYGLDVLVLDPAYTDPESQQVLGIKARVVVGGGQGFSFDVYQFRQDVYERCAREAGLEIEWKEVVVPDDERRGGGYWAGYLEKPTFSMLEARRVL
ncbi:S-adenosyl-L-methionine-dependent methyltransferase [Macroventuria anomochaeta]|uniref:S-adenosyl-L-methionine-dependent methyltransferase n=1 Tax=Macroventuria anomochaeta TaxID=301207 RepID=A0ACB6RMH8_9PLEO|nr:S-adenosyl-L-methionine-dependent methyltransferase [Macroventuria anomochaeta]KAF2623165.1 S-adenosyl-L-methionine-dependent methyltransferase [Macroventuria anomochaeta]